MKKIYVLESVDEVIHVFRDARSETDSFPYAGKSAILKIINGNIKIAYPEDTISFEQFVVSENVDSDELLISILSDYGISLSFTE